MAARSLKSESVAPNANRTANKYGFAYQHAEVFTKIEYFRLKTLDKDGSIKYTPVAIIQPSTKSLDIAVFPESHDRAGFLLECRQKP